MSESFTIVPISVEVEGKIVSSNFDIFKEQITTALDNINTALDSDDDFAQAESDTKTMKQVEQSINASKDEALKQAEELNQLFDGMNEISSRIRTVRLDLEKKVKNRKEEIKKEIIDLGMKSFDAEGIRNTGSFRIRLVEAIKGKRTLNTMNEAVDKEVMLILGQVKATRKVLDIFEEAHGKDLTMDRHELELREASQVNVELQHRLDLKIAEDKRKAEEAARKEAEDKLKKQEKPVQAVTPAKPPASPPAPPVQTQVDKAIEAAPELVIATEWDEFKKATFAAIAPLKQAREALTRTENIEKAARFAQMVNDAWKEVNAS